MGRFIPTPVGNTRMGYKRWQIISVHPHACGEHNGTGKSFSAASGSSPRLWGTRVISIMNTAVERFIPTPVGNTPALMTRHSVESVHPHACGEHFLTATVDIMTAGSSPRLWGTHFDT